MRAKKSFNRAFVIAITALFALAAFSIVSVPADAKIMLANSNQWTDIYSVMIYAWITGNSAKFLVSDRHGPLMLNEISKEYEFDIYSNDRTPYFFGYEQYAISQGYQAKEYKSDNINLYLAERLPDNITKFIIIDPSYGYNAVSVGSYALLIDSYVLFADENNINEVLSYLNRRTVDKIILYGTLDREVTSALQRFNPQIINKEGDRFANNIEIVKEYKKLKDDKQIILTNGEFIEADLIYGQYPVVFIGNQDVPEIVRDYIKESNIEVGVLIGNELVNTATIIRRQLGISTFVKFARGARQREGPIAQVEGLDIYYLPIIDLNLRINRVRYNLITRQIEVTFENRVEQSIYFKGTYTLRGETTTQTFGDISPIFIDGLDQKTITYDIEPVAGGGEMSLKAYVIYGESRNGLERVIDETFTVESIEYLDETQVSIQKVIYDKSRKRFLVYIQNIGNVGAHAKAELVDIQMPQGRRTYTADNTIFIEPGKTKYSIIKTTMEEDDLLNNPSVHTRAYFGEREDTLIKIVEGDFDLIIRTANVMTYILLFIIILLLLFFFIAWRRKKKKKEGHSGSGGHAGHTGHSEHTTHQH